MTKQEARVYYEIWFNNRYYITVYDSQDIIRECCDIVNGLGISPDNIQVKEYVNGGLTNENQK